MNKVHLNIDMIDDNGVVVGSNKPTASQVSSYLRQVGRAWLDSAIRGVEQGRNIRLIISFSHEKQSLSLY